MRPRSCKNKGKRAQNEVVEKLLHVFTTLEPDDVKSTTMGDHGEDVKLSPAARRLFPFSIEVKNQEKLNIWASYEQAAKNAKQHIPLLIFKRNRSDMMCSLKFDDLLNLIKRLHEQSGSNSTPST